MPNTSKAWRFFERRGETIVGCKICGKSIQYHTSTTAMINHIESYHRREREESDRICGARENERKRRHVEEKKDPDEYLALAFSTSAIPFRFLKNKYFAKFVGALDPDFQLMTPDQLTTKFSKNAVEYIGVVKKEIRNVQKCFITVDGWESKFMDNGLYAVFLYYIDANFERKNVFLGIETMNGSATAGNVGMLVVGLLNKYDIDFSKVVGGVTDAGSNITSFLDRNRLFHIHCAAHCLALVIKKTSDIQYIKNVLSKVRLFASFLSRSKTERAIFRERSLKLGIKGRLPLPFCETRWGASLLMAQSFLLHYQSLNARGPCQQFLMSEDELEILSKYVEIMAPYSEALQNSESDSTFSSEIIVQFAHLAEYSSKLSQRSLLAKCLYSETNQRFDKYLENDALLLAVYFDPRFCYLSGILRNRRWEEIEEIVEEYNDSTVILGSSPDQLPANNSDEGESSYFQFILSKQQSASEKGLKAEISSYKALVMAGRPSPKSSPLQFWLSQQETYPVLSKMSKDFLSSPQSSAQVERLFSSCGTIVNSCRRNRMKPETLNNQLLNSALASLKMRKDFPRDGEDDDYESDDSDVEETDIGKNDDVFEHYYSRFIKI